jgi:putative DNA primase/helicase
MTPADLAEALAAAGLVLKRYTGRNHRCPCPSCGRGPRDDTCGVTIDDDGAFVSHCFRCEWATSWRPRQAMRSGPRPSAPVRAPQNDKRPFDSFLASIFNATDPLKGTHGQPYLEGRGCLVPACRDVRFHRNLRGFPAIVSRVTDPATNAPMTLHVTLLAPDGSGKADVSPNKLFMPGYAKKGGVIRLVDDADVEAGLGLAEGLETALSVMAAGWSPVWATCDAGNLAAFPVMNGIKTLTVFADNDASGTGQRAAEQVVQRWRAAGREARIILPPTEGTDWNDTLSRAA